MTGVVVRVILSRGFAFVRGDDSLSRFVHASDVSPAGAFDQLREGQAVEFDSVDTGSYKSQSGAEHTGLRAKNVRVVKADARP